MEEQAKTSSSSRQSIKDIRKSSRAQIDAGGEESKAKPKVVSSSRQIPMHARLDAKNTSTIARVEAKNVQSNKSGVQGAGTEPAQQHLNSTDSKTRSKFSKRFNMTGSGMTQADQKAAALGDRSQLGTPSTEAASMQSPSDHKGNPQLNPNIQDTRGDTN